MRTTCTAIAIRDNRLWLAHVGDSRAYLLRDGVLEQLSDDQTLHAQLIRDGVMTPAAAERSPGGNVILQALVTHQEISPTIWAEGRPLRSGDTVVLCSDGLYELVNNDDLVRSISRRDPQESCHELIRARRRRLRQYFRRRVLHRRNGTHKNQQSGSDEVHPGRRSQHECERSFEPHHCSFEGLRHV
jgi:serine/threonine protein phosphatase PrpC